ncbi:hypothetical protein V6N13_065518 [Hibiscus sabdariffa]
MCPDFDRFRFINCGELKIDNGQNLRSAYFLLMDKESTNSSKDLEEIQKPLKSAAVVKSCFTEVAEDESKAEKTEEVADENIVSQLPTSLPALFLLILILFLVSSFLLV